MVNPCEKPYKETITASYIGDITVKVMSDIEL